MSEEKRGIKDEDIFEREFKEVYGEDIYKDFIGFEGSSNNLSIEEKLVKYFKNIRKVKNFYKNHSNYSRFILITIERFYNEES